MTQITQAQHDLKAGYDQMIATAGTDFTLEHDNGTTETIRGHVIPMGKDDIALVNALGVDAVFVHCLDTPTMVKFEKLTSPSGREYSIEAVHEIYVNNTLVGQKVVAR